MKDLAEDRMNNSLNERLRFEELISKLSARYIDLPSERVDDEIHTCLEMLGRHLEIERTSLSQFSENRRHLIITHSFAGQQSSRLLEQDFCAIIPEYSDMVERGETILFRRVPEDLPDSAHGLREYYTLEGVKSHLGLPMKVGDIVLGVLGFTAIGKQQEWPGELINRLKVVAGFLVSALMQKKHLKAIDDRARFEILIADLSASMVNVPSTEIERNFTLGLSKIAQFFGLDRSFFGLIDQENKGIKITCSWTVPGAEIVDDLEQAQFPWVSEQILKGKTILINSIDELPDDAGTDKNSCILKSIKSFLVSPLKAGGIPIGAISFNTAFREFHWPRDLVQRTRLVAEIFSNALDRKQNEEKLKRAFEEIKKMKDRFEAERNYLREEIKSEHNIKELVGQGQVLLSALDKVRQVAPTDATVLIQGETGTGKELFARAVHNASRRRDNPLVKVNCAALPSHLIESELFGHEKGAFTGAHSRQIGRFELADNATIFLDEIGELPMELQPKLLRVLQEGEFERLGSGKTLKVNVRIVAATNRDLEAEVRNGRFRQDLWFRLNIFPITVPPLRERSDDIPLLVNWFVNKFNKKMGRDISRVSQKDMESMTRYNWPGNVRELANCIERAVINTRGSILKPAGKLDSGILPEPEEMKYKTLVERERKHIIEILEETRWKVEGLGGAARVLGLHPSTLRGRMRKYNIHKPF